MGLIEMLILGRKFHTALLNLNSSYIYIYGIYVLFYLLQIKVSELFIEVFNLWVIWRFNLTCFYLAAHKSRQIHISTMLSEYVFFPSFLQTSQTTLKLVFTTLVMHIFKYAHTSLIWDCAFYVMDSFWGDKHLIFKVCLQCLWWEELQREWVNTFCPLLCCKTPWIKHSRQIGDQWIRCEDSLLTLTASLRCKWDSEAIFLSREGNILNHSFIKNSFFIFLSCVWKSETQNYQCRRKIHVQIWLHEQPQPLICFTCFTGLTTEGSPLGLKKEAVAAIMPGGLGAKIPPRFIKIPQNWRYEAKNFPVGVLADNI